MSYPSIPLFLLYNPELVNAMIRGIFRFAEMPVWSFDFAPHDLGAYPWCSGQLYGLSDKNGKYFCGSLFPAEAPVTPQFPYIMPAKNNVYDFNGQMPVEECGNMLIIAAAAVVAGADCSLVKRNFGTLKKWVKYLEKYGLQPENQLCTDDFAGHLANNVNLSIKALVGIESFSIICKTLGKDELAEDYFHRAERFAEQIKEFAGKDVMPLAYKMKNSYSVKYNILFDKLFGFNLIGKEICERETDYYITKNKRFGVPLDNRESYTKADWILWASAITDDRKKAEELYSPELRYLKETPTRVPFGDWYYSDRGDIVHFINRSVVGAVFAPLLKLSGKMKVNWE